MFNPNQRLAALHRRTQLRMLFEGRAVTRRRNPQHQFGPYLIQRELARGGQGAVYLAYHQTLKVPVAIKVLLDNDRMSAKRFLQEGRVLAKLKHPNLLKVIDLGYAYDKPYMAMEYIQGQDLKALYRNAGAPRMEWLQDAFADLCDALDYIHSKGLTHRDLKPANIFLEDVTDRVVLVDFGLVKRDANKMGMESLDRSRLSVTGEVAGTPAFMAPEQADPSFGQIGPWTDFYALGATMYYMLTGQPPFQGPQAYNVLVKLMQSAPVDPREHNPEIPDHIATMIMRCLSKEPSQRPQTGTEFIDAMNYEPPAPRRLYRFGAAVLAIAGIGSLIGYLTDTGYAPEEAVVIAEDIAETTSQTPEVVVPPETTTPAPRRAESIDELVEALAETHETDHVRFMELAERMVELYPNFNRAYLYRASAYEKLNETETDPVLRSKNVQQVLADMKRAIDLTADPIEQTKFKALRRKVLQSYDMIR